MVIMRLLMSGSWLMGKCCVSVLNVVLRYIDMLMLISSWLIIIVLMLCVVLNMVVLVVVNSSMLVVM